MAEPTRTPTALKAQLLERFERVSDLCGHEPGVHRSGVAWMDAGGSGTAPVLARRTMHRAHIAWIIRDMQPQFDLED